MKLDNGEQFIRSFYDVPFDLLTNQIFAFVGDHQYRFMGGVCRSFEAAYSVQFPSKLTCYIMSSIKHAKICYEDAPPKKRGWLLRSASDQTWYY
jgi:hypothetical protein